MTFFDNLLKSFSENFKQLTKINDFLLFLHFRENHIALRLSRFSQKFENL